MNRRTLLTLKILPSKRNIFYVLTTVLNAGYTKTLDSRLHLSPQGTYNIFGKVIPKNVPIFTVLQLTIVLMTLDFNYLFTGQYSSMSASVYTTVHLYILRTQRSPLHTVA